MAGISKTGHGSTENHFLGRGCVFLAELDTTGAPGAWRELGDTCVLEVEADTSTIEHFSCKNFNRVKDAEYISQITFDVSLTVDELSYENFAEFFVGTTSKTDNANNVASPSNAAPGGSFYVPNNAVAASDAVQDTRVSGRWYDIYISSGGDIVIGPDPTTASRLRRVYNITNLSPVIVNGVSFATQDITVNSVLPANTLGLDPADGMIFVPSSTSPVATEAATGALFDGYANTQGLLALGSRFVDIMTNAADGMQSVAFTVGKLDRMTGFTGEQKIFALKFRAFNGTKAGEVHELLIHQIRLRPTGTIGFIQEEEIGQIELAGSIEANALNGYFDLVKVS